MNHLSQRNTKAMSEKRINNLIAENFAQVSTKISSNQFDSIRIKEKDIKFTSDNTESYNQPST